MDMLSRLERAVEGLVEGVFSRAFRTQLQPIEIAKRLTREMESHRAVSVTATYVPNVYTVRLSPDDHATFQPISVRLLAELEQYLREFVAEHGYQTVGPIAVRLAEDAGVKSGETEVSSASDASATPSATPPPSMMRSYPAPGLKPARTESAQADKSAQVSCLPATALEVVAGEGVGMTIVLKDGLTIGRGPSNAVSLAERNVSRHHAEIVWEDDAWVIRDRGSTNGTFVNDHRITEHALMTGDIIRIGETRFRAK